MGDLRPGRSVARAQPGLKTAAVDGRLQRFLERFTAALTSGDGSSAASAFEYPSLMVMADAARYGPNQVLQEPSTVSSWFAQAPQQYQAKGITTTFPDVEWVHWLGKGVGLVRCRFPYVDVDGNDMGDGESSLYVIRRNSPDEYAIVAAIALGTDSDQQAEATEPYV